MLLRRFCGLALSVLAHFVIILSIDSDDPGGTTSTMAAGRAVEKRFEVWLTDVPVLNRKLPPEDVQPAFLAPGILRASKAYAVRPQPVQASGASSKMAIIPVVLPSPPHYFHPGELSEKPRVLQNIPSDLALAVPDVPPQTLALRLYINERGDVDDVVLEDSQLSVEATRPIVRSFLVMKFAPGRIGQEPVKSQLKIEVKLDIPPENLLPVR